MIPQSFIQDLLGRVDIVEVVDRYVKLKRSGANYSACCPFHTEKSPSFTVSPTKQFYHCFGCGAHHPYPLSAAATCGCGVSLERFALS